MAFYQSLQVGPKPNLKEILDVTIAMFIQVAEEVDNLPNRIVGVPRRTSWSFFQKLTNNVLNEHVA